MVAVEGIMIAVIAVVAISGTYVVMTSQYEIIDTFNSITQEQRESGQEDVDLQLAQK